MLRFLLPNNNQSAFNKGRWGNVFTQRAAFRATWLPLLGCATIRPRCDTVASNYTCVSLILRLIRREKKTTQIEGLGHSRT